MNPYEPLSKSTLFFEPLNSRGCQEQIIFCGSCLPFNKICASNGDLFKKYNFLFLITL